MVTRAREQARNLSSALLLAGARVVALPVVSIADPTDGSDAMRRAVALVGEHHYHWVVFSSVNAVERFVALLGGSRSLGSTRIAAVGGATSAALEAHGLEAHLVPKSADAEALAAAMPTTEQFAVMSTAPGSLGGGAARARTSAGEGRVLYPRASEARDVLVSRLRAKGWEVDDVEAYRTVAAGPNEGVTQEALASASLADVVTFTSPSTVRFFLELAIGRRIPPVVACIGPVTADAAVSAGLRVDVVAEEQSADGLVRALVAYREARRAP